MDSPRTRFRKNQTAVEQLRNIVTNPNVLAAFDTARMQMEQDMKVPDDVNMAVMQRNQLLGAKKFIEALCDLAAFERSASPFTDNLPHPEA